MEIVTGYVEHIVFRNEENGYTVFQLESEAGEVTCVGTLNFISEGERLEIKGDYVNHNIYGSQLKISSYEMKEPEDLISIERYLGSGAIKGVGAALAGRIVRKFKTDTFRIIEEEPERLAEVNGISERKAREIALQVDEKKGMRKVMIYLQNFGISTALAAKIYQKYGSKVYEILETNPYKLADDIEGVGFKTADEIAAKIDEYTGRGSTFLRGRGSYSKEEKEIVMCACNNKQMYTIRKMAKEIDPKAFIVIMESNDVVGEGFKEN